MYLTAIDVAALGGGWAHMNKTHAVPALPEFPFASSFRHYIVNYRINLTSNFPRIMKGWWSSRRTQTRELAGWGWRRGLKSSLRWDLKGKNYRSAEG